MENMRTLVDILVLLDRDPPRAQICTTKPGRMLASLSSAIPMYGPDTWLYGRPAVVCRCRLQARLHLASITSGKRQAVGCCTQARSRQAVISRRDLTAML